MPVVPADTTGQPLAGRRIILGVTAGIAAYKAALVLRGLTERGADVRVIPTPASLEFVGAATWEALSHNPVTTSVFDEVPTVAHVNLGQTADAILVVPATADFLARARMGRADDLLSASLLMTRGPVIFTPAMHTEMWEHPATRENVRVLRERGVQIIEPAHGRLTGSDTGAGRLPEPEQIIQRLLSTLATENFERDLEGRHVVVTAGGTCESLDPVRVLTNRSTGKQGVALATAALARGARVTLIAASLTVLPPAGATVVQAPSAADMARAVATHSRGADALVMVAAVSDFTTAAAGAKMKKDDSGKGLTLQLEETEDILKAAVAAAQLGEGARVVAGFAAETGDERTPALAHAQAKAARKGADILAFNDLTRHTFGDDSNHLVFLDREGNILGESDGTKDHVSHALWTQVVARLRDNDTTGA